MFITQKSSRYLGALALLAAVTGCDDTADAGRDPTDAVTGDAAATDATRPGSDGGCVACAPDASADAGPADAADFDGAPADGGRDAAALDAVVVDAADDAQPGDALADAQPADASTDADAGPDQGPVDLPACAPITALGPLQRDLPYGPERLQIFDLLLPIDAPNPPIFVWIHGGGWQGGTHSQMPLQVRAIAARGIAVVSLAYRLSDDPFPTPISDVRAGLRYLQDHGVELGLDGTRIAVGGSSAGGHLAAISGTASDITELDLDPLAGPAPRPLLVVDFFGPSALLEMQGDMAANGCPEDAICHECAGSPETLLVDCAAELSTCPDVTTLASPVTHVDHNDSPFLVLHGANDCVVATPQGQRMHDALVAAGVSSSITIVPDAGHNVGEVGTEAVWQAVYSALDAHLKGCVADEAPPPPVEDTLSACAVAACPDAAPACAADAACVAIDACVHECFGTAGCPASCAAGQPGPTVQRHRALFECARPASCY